MKICTFFGHRDIEKEIEPKLLSALEELILNKGVDTFYVGNQGNFDKMVIRVLGDLAKKHPHINYSIVLAYMPGRKAAWAEAEIKNSIYPEGLEKCPPKAAIKKRNLWMLKRSQFVVCGVESPIGNSAEMMALAQQQGKCVINIK